MFSNIPTDSLSLVCVCVCVCVCVHPCIRACVCVCACWLISNGPDGYTHALRYNSVVLITEKNIFTKILGPNTRAGSLY